MPMYLIERYLAHDETSDVHDGARRLQRLLHGSPGPQLLWCVLVPDDATVFCLFEGADEAQVNDVIRRVGFRIDRISSVITLP